MPSISTSRREFIKHSTAATVGAGLGVHTSTSTAKSASRDATEFDVIVVGAGSSGCVIANRLTEDPSVRVLLLEAGGPDNDPRIQRPADFFSLQLTEFDWNYSTEEEPGLNGRKIRWPRGKVLGGTSSINGMVYMRGHRLDFDAWNYLGNTGWSYADVLPYFKRSESHQHGASEYHGGDGPLSVAVNPRPSYLDLAFIEACKEMGYEGGPDWDFNGARQEGGAGLYQYTTKGGKRHSAAGAFLTPVLSRENLTPRPWSVVTRLLWNSGNRVSGVEYLHEGTAKKAFATREVILSMGAVDSPQTLMLSGIGPTDHLKNLGIQTRVDLPGVGRNLQDHLFVPFFYNIVGEYPGRFAGPSFGLFVRTRSGNEAAAPDLQFMGMIGHKIPYEPDVTEPWFAFSPTLARPQSAGTITLRDADPLSPPLIRASYLRSEADLAPLREGVKIGREIAMMTPLRGLLGEAGDPSAEKKTDRELDAAIREVATTMYHPVGTCKMGNDELAVVDPNLKVHGVEGLRIADASIMPTLVNGNTNAPCIMIGEKAADLVKTG